MAKRIQFRTHGGPEVLEYVDYQPPLPVRKKYACATKPSA
jgi:NADPH2:quinone reductase